MRAWCILASAAALAGCSTWSELNAGPVVALPTKDDPSAGGSVAVHGAIGSSSPEATSMFGMDGSARLAATRDTQHVALGDGVLYARAIGAGAWTARGGLQLVFERADEKLLVGGGPYAALMGAVALDVREYASPGPFFSFRGRDRTLLTFGPFAELDARFSRPSSVVFVGLAVGVAWATETVETGATFPIESPPPLRNPAIEPRRP
jgi:hypothetical protein